MGCYELDPDGYVVSIADVAPVFSCLLHFVLVPILGRLWELRGLRQIITYKFLIVKYILL